MLTNEEPIRKDIQKEMNTDDNKVRRQRQTDRDREREEERTYVPQSNILLY